MASITLSAYVVRIMDRRDGEFQILSNFTPDVDLLDLAEMYLQQAQRNYLEEEGKNHLSIVNRLQVANRTASGIVKSGDYGFEADLIESRTGNPTHQRQTGEAELLPFYYFLWIPRRQDEGLLFLQRFKQFGITSVARRVLQMRFNESFPDYELQFNPLLPKSYIEDFVENGRIVKARFIQYRLPADKADAIGHAHDEEEMEVEFSITAKSQRSVPIRRRLLEALSGQRPVARILELQDFQYDAAKVEVEIDGKVRTIDLGNLGKATPSFDITDQVAVQGGHPTFDSIHDEARRLAAELGNSIGIEYNDRQD